MNTRHKALVVPAVSFAQQCAKFALVITVICRMAMIGAAMLRLLSSNTFLG